MMHTKRLAQVSKKEMAVKAIAAGKLLLGRELVIQTNADFTPPGKRSARVVRHDKKGRRTGQQIRWYVSRNIFRSLPFYSG